MPLPYPAFLLLRLLKITLISLTLHIHFVNFEYFPTVIMPPFRRLHLSHRLVMVVPGGVETFAVVVVLPCLVLSCFFRVHPQGLFLTHAEAGLHCTVQEHHTPMGRVFRSYALEPSRGLCGSDTCMPVIDHKL